MSELDLASDELEYSGIQAFRKIVSRHKKVTDIETVSRHVYVIKRMKLPEVRIILVNVYILGTTDVCDILAFDKSGDCIVNMGSWASVTSDAVRICKEAGAPLFSLAELMGALNYGGSGFLNYVSPKARDAEDRSTG